MFDLLTPKQRVFGTLRNLLKMARDEDLNEKRPVIVQALDRCLSWESELIDRGARIDKLEVSDSGQPASSTLRGADAACGSRSDGSPQATA